MSSFRFNVNKTNNQLYNIRKKIDRYKRISEKTYSNVNSVKNSWTDPASDFFCNVAKNDEKSINDIIDSLYKFQENLENFSSELGNIFSNYGYSTSNMDIGYDSDKINYVIGELNNIETYMNRSIEAFATCLVPSDYGYKWLIDEVYNEAYRFRGIATSIRDDLNNIRNNIEDLVSNARTKNSRISIITLTNPMTRVSSPVVSVAADINIDLNEETKASVKNTNYHTTEKRNK